MKQMRHWPWSLIVGLLSLTVSCVLLSVVAPSAWRIFNPPPPPPLTQSVVSQKDNQPRWQINPAQPYEISLWTGPCLGNRGSKFTVTQNGSVVLYCPPTQWDPPNQRTGAYTVTLPAEAQTKVLQTVGSNQLMELDQSYSREWVMDGDRWVLSIKQGNREKKVTSYNHVPKSIVQFVAQLDELLVAADPKAPWRVTGLTYCHFDGRPEPR
jgi:hypothetical protein